MEIRDKDLKEWLRDLRSQETDACPDEEALASFVEGVISGAEREGVARHVLSCVRCRDAMAAVTTLAPERLRVPVRAERKAVELVPYRDPPWEIAVRFSAGAIEVVKNTGDRTLHFAPAYATVRGSKGPDRPGASPGSLVAFTRKIVGLDAEVELERVAPATSDIKVTMRESTRGRHPKNIRVNLHREGRELMSYMLQDGSATFDKVQFGNYTIDFTRRGIRIGEIALDIRGE